MKQPCPDQQDTLDARGLKGAVPRWGAVPRRGAGARGAERTAPPAPTERAVRLFTLLRVSHYLVL